MKDESIDNIVGDENLDLKCIKSVNEPAITNKSNRMSIEKAKKNHAHKGPENNAKVKKNGNDGKSPLTDIQIADIVAKESWSKNKYKDVGNIQKIVMIASKSFK